MTIYIVNWQHNMLHILNIIVFIAYEDRLRL
jgi:hypothetical protein